MSQPLPSKDHKALVRAIRQHGIRATARRSGVNVSTVSRFASGRTRSLSPHALRHVARACGFTITPMSLNGHGQGPR